VELGGNLGAVGVRETRGRGCRYLLKKGLFSLAGAGEESTVGLESSCNLFAACNVDCGG